MNPALLLAHFDRLADGRDAIPRLRRFILDLAVRGKLVPQDLNDEPARLPASAAALKKERRLSRGNVEAPTEQPYPLPGTWRWVRIGDQLELLNGMAFKPSDWVPSGIRIVRIQNLNRSDAPFNFCEPKRARERSLIDDGAFLISWSGTPGTSFGAFIWDRGPAVLNQHIFRCDFKTSAFCPEYLRLAINGRLDEMIENAHGGVGLQHITKRKLEAMLIGLPPRAEQHRIVAKVDELMALCDRLEAARKERESRRDRLVAASLHRLSHPTDAYGSEAFRADARFYLNHLPRLTTRPEHVKQLRQTILSLAVRGRLVPQDPADEPASGLLNAISKTRQRLYAGRKIPKPKTLPLIDDLELPFDVPSGWAWSMLGELCYQVSDGPHYSPHYVPPENGVPFLSTRNVRTDGFDLGTVKYISRADHHEFCKRIKPERGDIIYTKGGTTGIAKVNDLNFEFSVWVHLAVLRIEKQLLFPRYVEVALNSPHCYEQSQKYTQGTSNFDLGLTRMIKITVPLPPLAEQHRIVAKVDELMALCDRLEASLVETEADSRRLLEAVLHEALEPAESTLEAAE